MGFWIKNIVLAFVLGAIAYGLLTNLDIIAEYTKSFGNSAEQAVENKAENNVKADNNPSEKKLPETKEEKKSGNKAAEGLSNFYASIRPGLEGKGPVIRKNVVYLNEPQGSLEDILDARKMITRPYRKSWRGDTKSRPFRKGETLYQKLSQYGEDQGLEVIWWLDRDFIVKDPFRINRNIIRTSYQIGKAVEGHFENGIDVYFCNQHRNITLISGPSDYLSQNCILLNAQNAG